MKRAFAVCVLLVGMSTSSIAGASPPYVGCPPAESGFRAWDVSTQPYQADDATDLNGNGWVCARPVDDQTFTVGGQTYPIFVFIDDVVPL